MREEKINPLSEEERRQIEEKLKREEELEELYGNNPHGQRRIKKECEGKNAPTGGTRGGQQKRAETCRFYSGKKIKERQID